MIVSREFISLLGTLAVLPFILISSLCLVKARKHDWEDAATFFAIITVVLTVAFFISFLINWVNFAMTFPTQQKL